MHLLYIGLSSLLFLPHGAFPKEVKNGIREQITCDPGQGQASFWFQIQKNDDFKFIAYVNNAKKEIGDQKFSAHESKANTLILNNFEKKRDSGLYSCVSVNKNKLYFGDVIQLQGEPDPTPTIKPTTAAAEPASISTTHCVGNNHEVKKTELAFSLGCELHILAPLAAGCGLLLSLLIITILYCNRIRTRRCPHHYKRQPRNRPVGHNTLPNHLVL